MIITHETRKEFQACEDWRHRFAHRFPEGHVRLTKELLHEHCDASAASWLVAYAMSPLAESAEATTPGGHVVFRQRAPQAWDAYVARKTAALDERYMHNPTEQNYLWGVIEGLWAGIEILDELLGPDHTPADIRTKLPLKQQENTP